MPTKIKIKNGLKANIPTSNITTGEPLYIRDTNELYIGNASATAYVPILGESSLSLINYNITANTSNVVVEGECSVFGVYDSKSKIITLYGGVNSRITSGSVNTISFVLTPTTSFAQRGYLGGNLFNLIKAVPVQILSSSNQPSYCSCKYEDTGGKAIRVTITLTNATSNQVCNLSLPPLVTKVL